MKFTREIKIGLVVITGLLLLYIGMNFLKGLKVFAGGDNTYYVTFPDVSGLGTSTPIYAGGYQVGTVREVIFDYTHKEPTRVLVDLDDQMQVPAGSTAQVSSDMLGNVRVNLLLAPTATRMLKPGDTITGVLDAGALGKASELIPVVEKILPKLDSILVNVNKLVADPNIARTLSNAQTVTANLTTSTRELNRLMASLNTQVPGMIGKANGVLDNTTRLTSNLASVDVAGTMAQIDATIANVKSMTEEMKNNNGTLGMLMRDRSLYDNLNSTMRNADSLMLNLREHPKRYVHFSLFGKKDK